MVTLPEDPNGCMPGSWSAVMLDGVRQASVICPKCASAAMVGPPDHEISATGAITPSLECAYPPCDFHENVTLRGWHLSAPAAR